MIFLVPVITGEALGKTEATAVFSGMELFSEGADIVEKRLDEGQWLKEPFCAPIQHPIVCKWATAGTGIFGGPEAGYVIIQHYFDTQRKSQTAKVVFRWYNPRSGTNTCGAVVLATSHLVSHVDASCHIEQGNSAMASYTVNLKR